MLQHTRSCCATTLRAHARARAAAAAAAQARTESARRGSEVAACLLLWHPTKLIFCLLLQPLRALYRAMLQPLAHAMGRAIDGVDKLLSTVCLSALMYTK